MKWPWINTFLLALTLLYSTAGNPSVELIVYAHHRVTTDTKVTWWKKERYNEGYLCISKYIITATPTSTHFQMRQAELNSRVSSPQPRSGLAQSNCLSNWLCLKGVFSLFLDRAACHHTWQITQRDRLEHSRADVNDSNEGKKVRAGGRRRVIIIIIILFTIGKRHV